MLLATPGLSWFPARSTGDIGEPIPTALAGAQEIDGRNALRGLTAGAVEHSLAMQLTGWDGTVTSPQKKRRFRLTFRAVLKRRKKDPWE